MKNAGSALRLFVAGAFCAGLLAVGGCTKYASSGDLKKLDDANKAAVAAEKELEQAKNERRGLEMQLARKQADLDVAKAELEQAKNQ